MSPSVAVKIAEKIDSLEEQACAALKKTNYFECERLAQEAIERAHRAADYQRMTRLLMPLEESRRQKRLQAIDAGVSGRLDERVDSEFQLTTGCWLIEPPLVGADGRELRRQADESHTPILLLVREPTTQLGAWPIVMIGVKTIRAYVEPPAKAPDVAWFVRAAEALGDAAIEAVDPGRAPETQVDRLFEYFCTLRDHDGLHQSLAQACASAMATQQSASSRSS